MGSPWEIGSGNYTRKLRKDGHEATVTFRYLSGGEAKSIAALRAGEDGAEMDMGHMTARAVSMAIVSWTLPFEPTFDNVYHKLPLDVLDRLYAWVSLDGEEPPEQEGDADVPLTSSGPATTPGEPAAESA